MAGVRLEKGRNIPVNCGYHLRADCSFCGRLEVWCNGDCRWDRQSSRCVRNTGIIHYLINWYRENSQIIKGILHLFIMYRFLHANTYLAIPKGVQLPNQEALRYWPSGSIANPVNPSNSEWSAWSFIDYSGGDYPIVRQRSLL